MSTQSLVRTPFEKWQQGLSKAVNDSRWDAWDCDIQVAVHEYNRHLAPTSGYAPLDWQLVKAVLWVETGGGSPAWNSKPMQIGVAGDPGLAALLSGNEGGQSIVPPAWKGTLTEISVTSTPTHNIRAGIGYLLMRMASFEYRSVSSDSKTCEAIVKPGDSLERIASAQGTTVESLKKMNPQAGLLKAGQVLKYQKASVQRVIVGWRPISPASIALRYNGGGDPNYEKKLEYAFSLIRRGKAAVCAR